MKILITGDFCPNNRVTTLIEKGRYNEIYNDFIDIIKRSDYRITNLECPIVEGGEAIPKIGPALKTSYKSIEALLHADFNLVTLANNHIMDFGAAGLESTIECCIRNNIDYTGAGYSTVDAGKPFMKEIKGIKIAIINITENEFSTTTGDYPGANALNLIENYYQIRRSKEWADHVLIIVHGGHEGYQLPSPRMKQYYRFFIDVGADAVIGHHPHCFSGHEIYKQAPIFYSLGNFSFDWERRTKSTWNFGYAVQLHFNDSRIEYKILPYKQGMSQPGIELLNGSEIESFEQELNMLDNTIKDDELLERHFDSFTEKRKKYYQANLEPYRGRLLKSLYNRRILPSLVSSKRKRMLLNLVRCESHRDMLLNILKEN